MTRKGLIAAALLLAASAVTAEAQLAATVNITVKDHRFQPAQVQAPAHVPLVLRVKNLDPEQMEFESVSLRVEKVVSGNGEATIRLRPLDPGQYDFFDDFHDGVDGTLVVRQRP